MYITVVDADTYFSTRLNSEVWDLASNEDKEKAIVTAGKAIDRLNFTGSMTSASQSHQFPRDDDTVIPDDVKEACCELAYALLDGVDPELEYENLNMTTQTFGSTRSSYDRTNKPVNVLAGIVSIVAWRLLLPYLRDPQIVGISRVS